MTNISIGAKAGTGKTTIVCWSLQGVPKGMKPSDEQKAIISAVKKVKAKTKRVTAFSKAIQMELETRLPASVEKCTNHSFGLRCIKQNIKGKMKIGDGYKNFNICEELSGKVSNAAPGAKRDLMTMYRDCSDAVSLMKLTLTGEMTSDGWYATEDQIRETLSLYSQECNCSIGMVQEVLKISSMRTNIIDFDDMVAMPVMHKMKRDQVDLAFVDESQDMNRAQQELCFGSAENMVIVGDVNQSIFGFAGADPEAIPRMESYLQENGGLTVLPLYTTRRCPKVVVAEAQAYVPEFKAHESNEEGVIARIDSADSINQLLASYAQNIHTMVLCRTNAPLSRLVFALIRNNCPAYIRGKSIGVQLIRTIKSFKASSIMELMMKLEAYESLETQKLQLSSRPDRDDKMLALTDKCACIRIFSDGVDSIDGIVDRIEKMFDDKLDNKSICLSSVHKSKGLEATRIFILRPDLLPHPKISSKSAFNAQQERNLAYVAITRSKRDLIYINPETKETDDA